MKKILIYFSIFIVFCFFIPIVFSKKAITTSTENINNLQELIENTVPETSVQKYEYQNYKTIKLLHVKTGEIVEVNLDDYLYGVVSAEMPASYELEALKAQTIVARTYTLYQIINSGNKHNGADICDQSTCCQAWISKEDRLAKWDENLKESNWNKIVNAVDSTAGKIITYNGSPIDAFFHSNSGGTTETATNVWGGTNFPYLQSVETSGEDGYTQYSSEVVLTNEELLNKLKGKYSNITIDFSNDDEIKILDYTESNRVKTVKFGNTEISGVEVRTLLGLKSTNFQILKENNNIKFEVIGYGHGVGMSQTGADTMAKNGNNAEEIIKHFYTGVEITDINSL